MLYSNDTGGVIDPCPTWGNRVIGGLARRATVIKDLKNEVDEVLILDAGNSLFKPKDSPSANERKKARLIIMAYRRMGYQAVNIGSDDLLAGIEFLKGLQKGIHLPFLSANLLDGKAGKPIFKSHVIMDLKGIRVGIFGLTSDVRQNEGVTSEGYFISNPIAAAKGIVAELTKECDIIVALSNLGSFKEYNKLVQGVEGMEKWVLGKLDIGVLSKFFWTRKLISEYFSY